MTKERNGNLQDNTDETSQLSEETQEENEEQNEEQKTEKTPLTEEDYEKYDIPRKFKYMEDVVRWGKEAEKQKSKLETEIDALREEMREYLEKFDEEKKNATTDEEKQNIETIKQQFIDEFNNDPYGALERMFLGFEKRLEEKQLMRQQYEKNLKEQEELIAKVGEEKWTEILPELKKIVTEFPNLTTPKQVYAMWLLRQSELSEQDKTKQTQKQRAFSEHGTTGQGKVVSSFEERAKSVKSVEDLDKLAKEVGIM